VDLDANWTRDVSKIGHAGPGDLELTLKSPEDLEKAKPFLVASSASS
jgi:predicted transport protein